MTKKNKTIHPLQLLRLVCLTSFLSMAFLSVSAQTEHRNDSIHEAAPYRENTLPPPQKASTVPSELQKYATPISSENSSSSTLNSNSPAPAVIRYDYTKEKPRPQEMEPSHTNPFNGNYASGGYIMLDKNSYLSGSYSYQAFPLIGSIRESTLFYNRNFGSHFSFTGGVYGAKMMMPNVFNDFGFKGSLEWKVNDWLSFRGFGTYSINKPYYSLAMSPYMETTNYGGTMRIMFNKHIGVEGGVVREFNPFTGRWKTYPVVYPILKFGE